MLLDREKQDIRLLTIFPGTFNDIIHAKLDQVSLKSNPRYTALSYCWGDAKEYAEILVNGKKAQVRKSLGIALRYLRRIGDAMVVWADAICINQSDLKEKSSQVSMMGQIYRTGKSAFQVPFCVLIFDSN